MCIQMSRTPILKETVSQKINFGTEWYPFVYENIPLLNINLDLSNKYIVFDLPDYIK